MAFAAAIGAFIEDQPVAHPPDRWPPSGSAPAYCLDDYMSPTAAGGRSVPVFARYVRPVLRPIGRLPDPRVLVSPFEQSTFLGRWKMPSHSRIDVKELIDGSIRGSWREGPPPIASPTSCSSMPTSTPPTYHPLHAPVEGRVVDARVTPSQTMLKVVAEPVAAAEDPLGAARAGQRLVGHRYDPRDQTGYQFSQARRLVVLASPIGLVAVLPVGIAQVSSVILTAHEGVTLRKGEEIGYFQFGSSDVVVVFEAASNVCLTAQVGVHYRMGRRIGQADPVMAPGRLDPVV